MINYRRINRIFSVLNGFICISYGFKRFEREFSTVQTTITTHDVGFYTRSILCNISENTSEFTVASIFP